MDKQNRVFREVFVDPRNMLNAEQGGEDGNPEKSFSGAFIHKWKSINVIDIPRNPDFTRCEMIMGETGIQVGTDIDMDFSWTAIKDTAWEILNGIRGTLRFRR